MGNTGNHTAFARLDEFLDELRQCEQLDEDAADDCANALKAKMAANVAAQRDPYDSPWFPSKDGRKMLTNAMQVVTCEASGTRINMAIEGPEAKHQVGSARGYRGGSGKLGGFRRAIIPFSKIPGPFKAVLRQTLMKRFRRIFKDAA